MPERLKVCHFSSVHTTSDTRVFHRECVSLAKYFDVTLIAIGETTGDIQGVHVIAIPKPKNRWRRILFTGFKAFRLALKTRASLYHIHDPELLCFGMLFAFMGKKVIYDIHENTRNDLRNKQWIPRFLEPIIYFLYFSMEWLASKWMHFIPVVANEEAAKKSIALNHYTIIQNYAPLELLRPYINIQRSEIEGYNLFYVGTLYSEYYNILKVIEAIGILQSKGMRIHLHCVGYNFLFLKQFEGSDLLQKVSDQLHFYGHLRMSEAYKIAQQCQLGLCLKNQPNNILLSHERKLFEYIAVGLPVISCKADIYKEIVEGEGIGMTTDLDDPEAIAATLEKLFMDKTLLNKMSQNALNLANTKMNWESESQKLIQLYQTLLKNQSA